MIIIPISVSCQVMHNCTFIEPDGCSIVLLAIRINSSFLLDCEFECYIPESDSSSLGHIVGFEDIYFLIISPMSLIILRAIASALISESLSEYILIIGSVFDFLK